jgi:hypothetical protein
MAATFATANRTDAARPLVLAILEKCIARIEALDLKGKKADEATLHYLAGAVAGLDGLEPATCWIGNIMVYEVAIRGLAGLREVVASMKARAEAA